jgi:hypothetical protein
MRNTEFTVDFDASPWLEPRTDLDPLAILIIEEHAEELSLAGYDVHELTYKEIIND